MNTRNGEWLVCPRSFRIRSGLGRMFTACLRSAASSESGCRAFRILSARRLAASSESLPRVFPADARLRAGIVDLRRLDIQSLRYETYDCGPIRFRETAELLLKPN